MLAQSEKEYIRPILLIQAQDKNGEANVDAVKQHLLSEYENKLKNGLRSTGQTKELEDENLFSPTSKVKIVITVEALKEGWDCSFAYVLASLQNINSATDVEQLLGRVLRMPYAKLRQNDELNKAYAHVISSSIAQATMLLKDRMVQNMGFNKWEADTAIVVNPQPELDLGQTGIGGTKPKTPEVIISVPFEVKADTIPTGLQPSVQKLDNSQGTSLVINKGTTDEEFDQIEQAVIDQATPKQKAQVKEAFDDARAERQAHQAPENWNATFALIPQLGLFVEGEWQVADKETIEDSVEWSLLDFPVQLEGFNIRETVIVLKLI